MLFRSSACSKIYTAKWINGCYEEWDAKEQQLKRNKNYYVILKVLENVESANQSWLEEVCNLKVFEINDNFIQKLIKAFF